MDEKPNGHFMHCKRFKVGNEQQVSSRGFDGQTSRARQQVSWSMGQMDGETSEKGRASIKNTPISLIVNKTNGQ